MLSRRLLADVLLVLALNAGKDYLLAEVGVFWVLVRVLACGALAVMVWLVTSGRLQTKRFTEVRLSAAFCVPWYQYHCSGQWLACRHCYCSCGMRDCSLHYTDYLQLGMCPSTTSKCTSDLRHSQSDLVHPLLTHLVQIHDWPSLSECICTNG